MLIEISGRRIEIARPEKWVWYDERCTILDLARYYVAVSPWLLAHLERRPVVYETYPGTVKGPSSFEQDPPEDAPRWVKRSRVRGRERLVTYVVADSAATLVYLVSLFMVTLHVWQSTTRAIEKPDFLLLDLDPQKHCTLAQLGRAAVAARDLLRENDLEPIVKTSGARGLHVVVPLRPRYAYKTVRELAYAIAKEMTRREPEHVTSERDPKKRGGAAVYIDWGQVGRGMTIVPPYTPRACPGAPVSMPIAWSDVEGYARSRSNAPPSETFAKFNIGNAVDRLKRHGDLWARWDVQPLTAALKAFAIPR